MKDFSLNLNKSKWKSIKLGDLVTEISDRVDNPKDSSYDYFVGLDNFISGDLKIKSWTDANSITSSAKSFKVGDILFARRNVHLKRASNVDFEGCCSGDAFVLRPNKNKVDPKFLVFLLNSNSLWDYAISEAAGTMSKRVKWRDLSKFTFFLPPNDIQIKISNLLWEINKNIEDYYEVVDKVKELYQAKIEKSVPRNGNKYWNLSDIITIRRGITYKSTDFSNKNDGIPLLNLKCVKIGGGFNNNGIKYFKGNAKIEYYAKNSDLIIACTDITRRGRVVGYPLHDSAYIDKKILFTMDLAAISIVNEELSRDYLYYVLKANWVHWILFAHSPGTTVLHLDSDGFKKIKLPKIDKDSQKKIVGDLKFLEMNIEKNENRIKETKSLQKKIINEIFI